MTIDYQALKAELLAGHPATGPYNANDQIAADELNALTISKIRETMTGAELWALTDIDQLESLSAERRGEWLSFCAIAEHDTSNGGVAQTFGVKVFAGATVNAGVTQANIGAARQTSVSRVSELNLGVSEVTVSHVVHARSI